MAEEFDIETDIDEIKSYGEAITNTYFSFPKNNLRIYSVLAPNLLSNEFILNYPEKSFTTVEFSLSCGLYFVRQIPIQTYAKHEDIFSFAFTGPSWPIRWESVRVSVTVNIEIPHDSFLIDNLSEKANFSNRHAEPVFSICNDTQSKNFYIINTQGELKDNFYASYNRQKEEYRGSQVVAPGSHLAVSLSPHRKTRPGTYHGSIHVMDAFGRNQELDLSAKLDTQDTSLLGRLKKRRKRKRQAKIEDLLVKQAASNDGILSKEELPNLAKEFSAKELLTVLQRLEDEGFVESSEGVFIFKQFVH